MIIYKIEALKMNRMRLILFVTLLYCSSPTFSLSDHSQENLVVENNLISETDNKRPKIQKSLATTIEPAIKNWLQFYHLNILDFTIRDTDKKSTQNTENSESLNDSSSLYNLSFNPKKHDIYQPRLHDYSPNKQKYLNLLQTSGVYRNSDGKYHYMGGDDCQEIYLIDRKNKTTELVFWMGASEFVEAIFWLDNDTFIAVGRHSHSEQKYFIQVVGQQSGYYEYITTEPFPENNYFIENIKSRGVTIL